MHVLGGGLLRCGVCWGQGRSAALHVAKGRKETDTASFACYGRFQGYACTQPSVPEQVLEAQLAEFFAAFAVPGDLQQRILDLYARDREREVEGPTVASAADPAQRRTQLEARLERQKQLYELGDWTRDRYLLARQEVLAELAEVDTAQMVTWPEQNVEALERLGAYVREVKAAWVDADKANRRLLVRTLFEQLWVLGARIVAVKPAAQFAPFFHLMRGTVSRGAVDEARDGAADGAEEERGEGMQLLYLDPTSPVTAEEDAAAVGVLAHEIARDTIDACHGREANVRTSGPDGRRTISNHIQRDRFVACSKCILIVCAPAATIPCHRGEDRSPLQEGMTGLI